MASFGESQSDGRARTDLAEEFSQLAPDSQEHLARFLLNVLNLPVRNFIIPLPDGKTPYLHRFVLDEGDQLIKNEERSKVYLHFIYASDEDRDPHDHPFDFESQIIWGSYREQRYHRACKHCANIFMGDVKECKRCGAKLHAVPQYGPRHYEPGMVNVLEAHGLHRLEVVKGPVVTLVRRGPKVREWGFQTEDGWEHHASYIKRKFPGAKPTEID